LLVYPAKKQTPEQQSKDEGECFAWAKQQSGFDPMSPAPAPPAKQVATSTGPDGARVRGAIGGAARGAILGEVIDDDAGKGAEIGAAAGALRAGRRSRITQAQHQAQVDAANQQATAAYEQAKGQRAALAEAFKKGLSVCLEARGYSIK
jgi:hypothetical protein